MFIKKIGAKIIRDSRGENTISVFVKTDKGKFVSSSPSGKSTGRYEVKSYLRSLDKEVNYISKLDISKLNISKFEDLKKVEKYVKLGGNSLFALEASLLKALAYDKGKELYELLGGKKVSLGSVGNAIGGGLHSKGVDGMKPDFQEFHFIVKEKKFSDMIKVQNMAYEMAGRILHVKKRNDEGAWETNFTNEEALKVMRIVRNVMKKRGFAIHIGLDIAANSFFKKNYIYKNPLMILNRKQQMGYVAGLIERFNLFYVEDGLEENDFKGFSELLKKVKNNCLIVGDDLTTTNPSRLKRAIKNKSINAIIVKPNQIGSLIKVKEVVDICKSKGIKTIISHRSGETYDNTIADLAIGFDVDYIKTGIYGGVRKAKLKRLKKIEKSLYR